MPTNPLLLLALLLGWMSCTESAATRAKADSSSISLGSELAPIHRQVLLVRTANWDALQGHMYLLEWQNGWRLARAPIPIVVGKKGLAWGIGKADYRALPGPVKQEGDLKSPAGLFELRTAFGYAPSLKVKDWMRCEYVPITPHTMCIEDRKSQAYNRILEENQHSADWNSTDHMLRQDDLYEWGMWVEHNAVQPVPGAGSCIFLHVWRNDASGTAGCTAMQKEQMRTVLEWLDPARQPILLQVPENEYLRFIQDLALPENLALLNHP